MELLENIIEHCKKLKKNKKQMDKPIPGLLAICHGGAGVGKSATIKAVSPWAEKILRRPGQNPKHPRVIICAWTGKAASIIS